MGHIAEALDTIILDGKAFVLDETPLEGYFRRIDWRPTFIRRGPGPLRGYMARWEVFGERLFLTGLFGMSWIFPSHLIGRLAPDPDPFEPAQDGLKSLRLRDLFPDQAPLVFADWVTERLIVPMGPVLFFGSPSFGSFHATHRTIDVVEGRLRSFRDWNALEWARDCACRAATPTEQSRPPGSPEPILTTLKQRLAITADRDNIPMAEVLRRLIANGYKLRSLGTIAGLGAAASGRQDKTPEEQE